MDDVTHWAIEGIIGIFGTLLVFLLRKRDDNQQTEITDIKKQIDDLYHKHNADAEKLHKLELEVALNVLSKDDVKELIKELKESFADRFDRLEKIIDDRRK